MSLNLELRDLAASVAETAGKFILKRRAATVRELKNKSSITDVVTEVDLESEQLVYDLILGSRPNDGFLGEEERARPAKSGVTWIVDPIDGTVNYLYDIPHYAVSIAAVVGAPNPGEWSVLAGAVYNPASGELFHAARGHGAFLGKKRLVVAPEVTMETALWLTGFAYAEEYRKAQGELFLSLIPLVRDIRRMGTASLDLAAIAAGRANVYFERTLSPWDHAAGELLVTEAGGVVCGFGGDKPSREAVFAGHPRMVKAFQNLVSANGGDVSLADISEHHLPS